MITAFGFTESSDQVATHEDKMRAHRQNPTVTEFPVEINASLIKTD
jgi:hypothetical protein